jgi:hypothetical protein
MWTPRVRQNNPPGKSPKPCPALQQKIFCLTRDANHRHIRASHPDEGRLAIVHERCGEMRWTHSARETGARDADGEIAWS